MTQQEAYQEACRRWGPKASVGCDISNKRKPWCYVFSECSEEIEDPCEGQGQTWEAAFADADRRAAIQKGASK